MNSVQDDSELPETGCPIRKSPDQSLFSGSPKLIAANHVLLRLLAPRHPPYALSSLTTFANTTQLKLQSSFKWLLSTAGHVEPCGNLPGPSGKAKYSLATDSELVP
jgi:hypothetical protein